MTRKSQQREQWIEEEIGRTDLGDKRRTKRLEQIVGNLSANPESSVPMASGTWAETKATYDFWDSPYLEPAMVLAGHIESTVERMRKHQVVLAVQDTTELNYTSHKALSGVGYLDNKHTRGLKVHSTLSVSPEGVPLGVIGQDVWARESEQQGKAQARKQRTTAEKESQKWLDALRETEAIIPETIRVVTIADREADVYDFLAYPRRGSSEFLIRATQDRCLSENLGHLRPCIESQECKGIMRVERQRHPQRPARIATLELRYTTVTIAPPQNRPKKEQLVPITLQAILVTEIDPPPEAEAIEWLLLTTLKIDSLQDLQTYVRWYSFRWLIERYHYVLKSGCQMERLQLQTAARLEMALATYAIVAWWLLWVTYLARSSPDSSCEQFLEPHQWQILYTKLYGKIYPHATPPTLAEVVGWIARLGGFLGRKGDGQPGVKVLWRGLRRLDELVETWLLFQSLSLDPL